MESDERIKNQVLSETYRAGLIIENSLLKKVNDGFILENLLKNNEQIPECVFNQRDSIRLIIKYKRYDLLERCTIRNLLRIRKDNKTYLEYLIDLYLKGENINLSAIDPFSGHHSLKEIADYYIIFARYDLQDYLPPLTDKRLTQKEKNPILKALSLNKNLLSILLKRKTFNDEVKGRLLSSNIIRDLDVILSLKDKKKEYKTSLDIQDSYSKQYVEEQNATLETLYNSLRPKEQELLEYLEYTMNGRCDEEAINTVLYSYIEQIYYGDKETIYQEIRRLIDIFKSDKNFTIEMGDDSYYSPVDNKIVLETMLRSSFNHELGHMLYHKLTDHKKDPYFESLIDNVRSNPLTLKRLSSFCKDSRQIRKKISARAHEYYDIEAEYDFDPESEKRIKEDLDTKKEEIISRYTKIGCPKGILNGVLNRTYTLEEYKHQHKRIQISSLKECIQREKACALNQISDIVDAIYKGQLYAGKLLDENSEKIDPYAGHGIYYYNSNENNVFDEIFANYCAIRKNFNTGVTYFKDPEYGEITTPMDCLRAIVGDEMVDYLEDFYQKEVLDSKKYMSSRSR